MAEWSKAHDWKSCVRLKRTEGSNPSLSAIYNKALLTEGFVINGKERLSPSRKILPQHKKIDKNKFDSF